MVVDGHRAGSHPSKRRAMMVRMSSGAWLAVGALLLGACGGRTGLLATAPEDAATAPPEADAGPDAPILEGGPRDASPEGVAVDAPAETTLPCPLGSVTGSVSGATTYFANGAAIPPGRYRVRYVDGCMKYNAAQDWSVNAYRLGDPAGNDHWWFVSSGQELTSAIPPGTVGFLAGQGGFATFDECVTANRALPPVDLTLSGGGPLAVWLQDSPYSDNVDGPNGRDPTWSLECAQ
jgi:hypothetical protein